MELGIVGKGGVGKTTLSALIAEAYRRRGKRIVAIDTDSNPNLGMSLKLNAAAAEAEAGRVARNVAVGPGGGMDGAELLAAYGRATPAGVTLISAMRVDQAGAGCTFDDVLDDEASGALGGIRTPNLLIRSPFEE